MSAQTTAFYNRLSFIYPLVDLLLRAQKKALFREVNKCPTGKLLEIGVGNGTHLKHYARHQVTGIDTSAAMLKAAQKNCPASTELQVMNGEALLFADATFDYVVLSHVVAVVDDPEQLLQETYRVLNTGGRLFILNHFTPGTWLGYIDRLFRPVARLLCFRSTFYLPSINTLDKFKLEKDINLGIGSYFKLLIYRK